MYIITSCINISLVLSTPRRSILRRQRQGTTSDFVRPMGPPRVRALTDACVLCMLALKAPVRSVVLCPPLKPFKYFALCRSIYISYPLLPAWGFSWQDPDRVREIMYGMIRKVTRTPVTVKCRIGVDDNDS